VAGAMVGIPPFASLLGQAGPPAAVWPLILLAGPVLLVADAGHKALRRRLA